MINCNNIEKFVDSLLTRELKPEEAKLLEEHIKNCSLCSEKVGDDLKIITALEKYYHEQPSLSHPPFDWDRFYTRINQDSPSSAISRLGWLPKLAFVSAIGCLIVGLSIGIYYKIKNIKQLEALKLPPHSSEDTEKRENSGNFSQDTQNKKEISGDEEEDYIKTHRRALTKRTKTVRKTLKSRAKEASIFGAVPADKAPVTSERQNIPSSRQIAKEMMKTFQEKYEVATTSSSIDMSNFIVIPLCGFKKKLEQGYVKKEQKCYQQEWLKIPIPIFSVKKEKLSIIEIMDPSCATCPNFYRTIKNVVKKYRDSVSYKIMLYPRGEMNTQFFMIGASLLTTAKYSKTQQMLETMLFNSKNINRKTDKELLHSLIKIARSLKIKRLNVFSTNLRSKHLKLQIKQHIDIIRSLKINPPSLLFFQEGKLMQYTDQLTEEKLENIINTFLK